MREIITVQVGQCGNQVGGEYWKRLCEEHGIDAEGVGRAEGADERRDVFFSEGGSGRWTARALLLDLEHKAIAGVRRGQLQQVFHEENLVVAREGTGAGNNWASGYAQGEGVAESWLELLDREAERSDHFEGTFLAHSIAGGTGSGLGSFLLEKLHERYPKRLVMTCSVFPSSEADVVVQPYNALLTLKRLALHADATLVLDNGALHLQAASALRSGTPSFAEINTLCAQVLAGITTPLRWACPGAPADLTGILAPLVPTPRLHFLAASCAPILLNPPTPSSSTPLGLHVPPPTAAPKKGALFELMGRLVHPKNILLSGPVARGQFIGLTTILRGVPWAEQVGGQAAVQRLMGGDQLPLVKWTPSAPQLVFAPPSLSSSSPSPPMQGVMLANHTGVQSVLTQLFRQYERMRKVGAYVENYRSQGGLFKDNLDEFDDAREVLRSLLDEYTAAQGADYLRTANS